MRTFRASNAHLPRSKNERSSPGFSKSHDDGCKSARVEFCIAASECDLFEVETNSEICGAGHILNSD